MHFSDIGRTLRYLRRNGIKETRNAVRERLHEKENYTYIEPSLEELERQRADSDPSDVTISIIVPAYCTDPAYMKALISSVKDQTYDRWELVIADASDDDSVESVVRGVPGIVSGDGDGLKVEGKSAEHEHVFLDRAIRYIRLENNDGISANTNEAIKYANGEYVSLLDHDDLLTSDAMYRTAKAVMKADKPVMVYSDEDKTDSDGIEYFDHNDKCDWNLDMILSNNYICHLMTVRKDVFNDIKYRSEYDGAQDYDLILQMTEMLLEKSIRPADLDTSFVHIHYVLYHWRVNPQSTAGNTSSKEYAYEAGRRSLESFFTAIQVQAVVRHSKHLGFYEVKYLPNIFAARPDIGAVCGRVYNSNGAIDSYMTDMKGIRLFTGMHDGESGHMHRFDITQDIGNVDIRCLKLRRSLWQDFENETGCAYSECADTSAWDYRSWAQKYDLDHGGNAPDLVECSRKISVFLKGKGYIMMYDPSFSTYIK